MSIISKLVERQEARKSTTLQQYRALLDRLSANEGNDDDVEQLETLALQLRYDPQSVADDLDAVRKHNGLKPVSDLADARMAEWRAAKKVADDYLAVIAADAKKHEAKLAALNAVAGSAYSQFTATQQAKGEIGKLTRDFSHLFRPL